MDLNETYNDEKVVADEQRRRADLSNLLARYESAQAETDKARVLLNHAQKLVDTSMKVEETIATEACALFGNQEKVMRGNRIYYCDRIYRDKDTLIYHEARVQL